MSYPKIGIYFSLKGDGSKLIKSNGSIDQVLIDKLNQWDDVIIDMGCVLAYPQLMNVIRARLHAYFVMKAWNNPNGPKFFQDIWNIVTNTKGFLITTNKDEEGNSKWFSFTNINVANRQTMEGLAHLIRSSTIGWQGIFSDVLMPELWSADQGGGEILDWAGMGFASEDEFLQEWKTNAREFVISLKDTGLFVTTNYGVGFPEANGNMDENFPYLNGGTWETNMLQNGYQPGLLNLTFDEPTSPWICSAPNGYDPNSEENHRKHLYGLASALLAGGFHSFGRYEDDKEWCTKRLDFFYLEYNHPQKGKYWLGNPTGKAFHLTVSKNKPVDLWVRYFDKGVAVVNPSDSAHSIYFDGKYRPINGTAKNGFSIDAHSGFIAEKMPANRWAG